MVDLVKIRKKAKEKSAEGAPKPEPPAPQTTTAPPQQAAAKVKKTADRRPRTAEEASSDQRAASRGDEKGSRVTSHAQEAAKSDATPPSIEHGAPSTGTPASGAAPGPARTSARAVSKLERYKEQAGKRRERAESIGKTAAEAIEEAQLELLTFAIAEESYAIEIENIVEIVPPRSATRVPNASASIVGIISLRGTIVTLIDVRRRLKHTKREETADTRIIVLDHDGETVGFEVDRVFRVVKIAAAEVEPHPVVHSSEQDESIRGVFRHGESLTILLDFAKLIGGREAARGGPRAAAARR